MMNSSEPNLAGSSSDITLLDVPQNASLCELQDYWNTKRGDRIAPQRADIHPEELRRHLPNLFLVDVIDGGEDLRYRLIGTTLTQAERRDATGRLFSDVYGDYSKGLQDMYGVFRLVITERRPVVVRLHIFWHPHSAYREIESVLLPLSDDAASVNIVMGERQLVPFDK